MELFVYYYVVVYIISFVLVKIRQVLGTIEILKGQLREKNKQIEQLLEWGALRYRAASATRGRIDQVSESERRWCQTRQAPNACFRTAGASRVTEGSQAGRKRKKKVGNPN